MCNKRELQYLRSENAIRSLFVDSDHRYGLLFTRGTLEFIGNIMDNRPYCGLTIRRNEEPYAKFLSLSFIEKELQLKYSVLTQDVSFRLYELTRDRDWSSVIFGYYYDLLSKLKQYLDSANFSIGMHNECVFQEGNREERFILSDTIPVSNVWNGKTTSQMVGAYSTNRSGNKTYYGTICIKTRKRLVGVQLVENKETFCNWSEECKFTTEISHLMFTQRYIKSNGVNKNGKQMSLHSTGSTVIKDNESPLALLFSQIATIYNGCVIDGQFKSFGMMYYRNLCHYKGMWKHSQYDNGFLSVYNPQLNCITTIPIISGS